MTTGTTSTPWDAGPGADGPSRTAGLAGLAAWYRDLLGWPVSCRTTADGLVDAVELVTGVCFDTLHAPLGAGLAALHRLGREETGPVAVGAGRVWFLVAPGSAEELPGLLGWLDWGGIALDLGVGGTGGRMPAPAPHDVTRDCPAPSPRPRANAVRGLPVWVRPPRPGAEGVLPAVGLERPGSPSLTPLVAALAPLSSAFASGRPAEPAASLLRRSGAGGGPWLSHASAP